MATRQQPGHVKTKAEEVVAEELEPSLRWGDGDHDRATRSADR
jgi:hypothetical protein